MKIDRSRAELPGGAFAGEVDTTSRQENTPF